LLLLDARAFVAICWFLLAPTHGSCRPPQGRLLFWNYWLQRVCLSYEKGKKYFLKEKHVKGPLAFCSRTDNMPPCRPSPVAQRPLLCLSSLCVRPGGEPAVLRAAKRLRAVPTRRRRHARAFAERVPRLRRPHRGKHTNVNNEPLAKRQQQTNRLRRYLSLAL
jgi:hypothetical protein